MPALLGRRDRHHHHVPGAGRDLPVAARAPIRLHRLERLHRSDLDPGLAVVACPVHANSAQATSATDTSRPAATNT
jgi:hypothetical protein